MSSFHLGISDMSKDYLLQKIRQKKTTKKQKPVALSIHIITENLTNTVLCHVRFNQINILTLSD